jgi:hypothetical protein
MRVADIIKRSLVVSVPTICEYTPEEMPRQPFSFRVMWIREMPVPTSEDAAAISIGGVVADRTHLLLTARLVDAVAVHLARHLHLMELETLE